MKKIKKKINILLSTKQQYYLLLTFVGAFFVSAIETIGLGSIAGFVMVLSEPSNVIAKLPDGIIKEYLIDKEFSFLVIFSAICLTSIFVLKNLLIVLYHYLEAQIRKSLVMSNSRKLYLYYLNSPYSFHLKNNPSKLINNIIGEVFRGVTYILLVLLLFKEILLVFGLLITLIFIDWKISFLIFTMMSVVSGLFYFSIQKKIKNIGANVRYHSEKMLQHLNQGIGGIKITKILGNQNYFIDKFFTEQNGKLKNEVYHGILNKLPRLFLEVLSVFTVTLTTLFFILNDRSIQSVLPILTLLVLIVIRMVPAFVNINLSLTNLQYNKISVKNLIAELEKSSSFNDKNLKLSGLGLNAFSEIKNITLSDVSFNYNNDQTKEVLNNISLKINSGEVVGVIGRSGAGKSTLIDLILGLLEPTKGQILVNSKNINSSLTNWQNQLGYVPQDIYLTDDNITRNIAFGINNEKIHVEKVKHCLKSAQLIDFVNSLPNKLETYIGDRGIRLSGGQKQRLGIARALYNDPKVLILDEATSSLDNETEENVINDILQLREKRTLIIIAHRLSTLRNCDKLFLFEEGKLIDQGTCSEIVARHKNIQPYLSNIKKNNIKESEIKLKN